MEGRSVHVRRTAQLQEIRGKAAGIRDVEPCAVRSILCLLDQAAKLLRIPVGVCQVEMDMPDGKKGDDEEKRCCRGADAGEPLAALPLLVVVRHLHHGAQRLIFRRVLFFFHSLLLFLCRRGAPEERGCRQTQSRGQRL